MEQARLGKVLEPVVAQVRDADKDAVVWAVRLPQVQEDNARVRSVARRFPMPQDSPAIK